jgi:tetratricopeptide (TPR) repeat protein
VLADDFEVSASAIGNLGMAFGKLADYQKALRLQKYALLLKQRIGKSQEDIARSHRLIAEAFAGLGNYVDSRTHTVHARDLFASIPGLSGDARKMGIYVEKLDGIIALKDAMGRSVDQSESNEDFANSLQKARTLASNQDHPTAALEYAKAIGIAQRRADKQAELQARLAVAELLYGSLGLFQEALPQYQAATTLARLIGNKESERSALWGLARTATDMGRFDEARKALETILVIQTKDRDGVAKFDVMALLSVNFLMEDQQNDGETYLNLAIRDAKQIVPVQKALQWFLREGRVFRSLDFIEEAVRLFQAALTLAEKDSVVGEDLIKLYQDLGNAYTVRGMQSEAISAFQAGITSAEALGNPQSLAWTWNKVGWAFVSFKDSRSCLINTEAA